MKILTLIPDATSYGVVTLIMLGVSSFTLPVQICLRFLEGNFNYFLQISAVIQFLIVVWGFFIMPVSILFSDRLSIEIIHISIGCLLGFCIIGIEKKLNRFFGRNRKPNVKYIDIYIKDLEVKNTKTVLSLTSKQLDEKNICKSRSRNITKNKNIMYSYCNLISILSMAISEEIIFRSYFINLAKTFSLFFGCFFIFVSIYIFGISHIFMGKHQAYLKSIYGVLFVFLTYFFESISVAVVAHIMLNMTAWKSSSSEVSRQLALYSYI